MISEIKSLLKKIKDGDAFMDDSVNKVFATAGKIDFPMIDTTKLFSAEEYPFHRFQNTVRESLKEAGIDSNNDEILETPKVPGPHLVVNIKTLFEFNKQQFSNIKDVAQKVFDTLNEKLKETCEVTLQGIFVNILFKDNFFHQVANQILNEEKSFGSLISDRTNKKVIVEYSSPNIAKQMSVGHLRSTIIGETLNRMLKTQGASILRRNYIGDRGTPFGKLMYSLLWHYDIEGDELLHKLESDPTDTMGRIYAAFKDIPADNKEEGAQRFFKGLEEGNPTFVALWEIIKKYTLIDFNDVYKKLDINFDVWLGESFTQTMNDEILKDLENSGYLVKSQGAKIVYFNNGEPQPASEAKSEDVFMIEKSDGASVYATRDLGGIKFRCQTLGAEKVYYVIGIEQEEHFKKLIPLAQKLGYIDSNRQIEFIGGGLYMTDGKKMSSRQGTTLKLAGLVGEITEKVIAECGGSIDQEVAQRLAVSALFFADLKNDRTKNINFDIDLMTKMQGDTGIYLQYSCVRIKALYEKLLEAGVKPGNISDLILTEQEKEIFTRISLFAEIISRCLHFSKPHIFFQYTLDIARQINNRYGNVGKILDLTDNEKQQKLIIIQCLIKFFDAAFEVMHFPKVERM